MSGATARRTFAVIVLAAAPTAILTWMGCSSSSSSQSGVVKPDPGGTYGAEIHVTVIGRGRVVSDIKGIDCPDPFDTGSCFASYIFTDGTADGASGGVKLTASTVEGSTFKFGGWKFDTTTPIGSKGRGPESCNPISRPGVAPPGDMNAPQLTLPFGQANGAPPAGQESVCAGYTGVPVAYNITATFIDTDAGVDAGPPDLFYQPASTGAAKELAILSGRLYWRFQSGASHGIATASTTVTGTLPGTPTVIVSPTQPLNPFRMDTNVVYQTSLGTLSYLTPGSTVPQQLSGAGTCVGVASDSSSIYCKTSTGLLQQWPTFSATTPNVWYSGLTISTGSNELASDSSTFGYVYYVDDPGTPGNAAIRRLQKPSSFDGGLPTPQDVATLRPASPFGLTTYNSFSRLYWMESDSLGNGTGFEASQGTSVFTTALTSSTPSLKVFAVDTFSSSNVYFGTSGTAGGHDQIIRTFSTSSTTPAVCRTDINGLGGIAVDSQYIYWTQADGGVYRTLKTNCL